MEPLHTPPKTTLSRGKKIIFTLAAILLFLIITEVFLRLVIDPYNQIGILEKEKTFASYQYEPWVAQYFNDLIDCGRQNSKSQASANLEEGFTRYVMFDLKTNCTTKTLVYTNGFRRTWNPTSTVPGAKVYHVGVFGGSTVEGSGDIDEETISSHISKILNAEGAKQGVQYIVDNQGVSGYTYTQSIIKLLLLLREGKRYDYVILYNGANDIDNAYDAGEVGALYGETLIKHKLQGTIWDNTKDFLHRQVGDCATCRGLVVIARNIPGVKDYAIPMLLRMKSFLTFSKAETKSDAEMAQFGQDIADYYAKSHDMLDAIKKAYGFPTIEFWQPTLAEEERFVGGESALLDVDNRLHDDKHTALFRLVAQDLDQKKLDHFYDISNALVGRDKPVYLDAVHVNGTGNAMIAKRITDVFDKEFPH